MKEAFACCRDRVAIVLSFGVCKWNHIFFNIHVFALDEQNEHHCKIKTKQDVQ